MRIRETDGKVMGPTWFVNVREASLPALYILQGACAELKLATHIEEVKGSDAYPDTFTLYVGVKKEDSDFINWMWKRAQKAAGR